MDTDLYPEDERPTKILLDSLLDEWEKHPLNDDFTYDGFYPFYFHQPIRILFIGRAAYDMAGCDYIQTHYAIYRGEKSFGNRAFHRRIFYMLHAVLEGFDNWGDVPTAHSYAREFASAGHVSFAFMNLSKISNETGKRKTQWKVLHAFVERSVAEIRKEIEILDPDLIITANITLHNVLDKLQIIHREEDDVLDVYRAQLNGRNIHVFNTYHWSDLKHEEYRAFYECIRDACRLYGIKARR